MPPIHYALRARYLFPAIGPPMADGLVSIHNGLIEAIGENTSPNPPIDLGSAAILPGLVNAHTHLEFSHLAEPLGEPNMPFPQWIQSVVEHRRSSQPADEQQVARQAEQIIRLGLAESLAAGVTTIGEIAQFDWPKEPFTKTPINSVIFLELLGLTVERTTTNLEVAGKHLLTTPTETGNWQPGISPHAPYSIRWEAIEQLAQLSAAHKRPLAMHLAESPEEIELLASGAGPFQQVLSDLEVWDPSAIPRGIEIMDYLQLLSLANRALVIHGNYLSPAEITFLAEHNQRMSVVYCPRTHAYFGHGDYPAAGMVAAGVNLALGTDSRASNPDLSLLSEMRAAAICHTDVSPEEIIKMGTLNGAQALGLANQTGMIKPGLNADLTIVRLPNHEGDPYELLLDSDEPVTATLNDGEQVYGEALKE